MPLPHGMLLVLVLLLVIALSSSMVTAVGWQLLLLALKAVGVAQAVLTFTSTTASSRVAVLAPPPEVAEGPKQAGPFCSICRLASVFAVHRSNRRLIQDQSNMTTLAISP